MNHMVMNICPEVVNRVLYFILGTNTLILTNLLLLKIVVNCYIHIALNQLLGMIKYGT